MKGFKDSSGKFHPMTDSKGVRKSRDQSTKSTGVKIERKSREEDIEWARTQLIMSKGQPLRQQYFRDKIAKLRNEKQGVRKEREPSKMYLEYLMKFPDSHIAMDVRSFGSKGSHGHFGDALKDGRYEDAMYRADSENLVKLHELGIEKFLSKEQNHPDDPSPFDTFTGRYNWAKDYVKSKDRFKFDEPDEGWEGRAYSIPQLKRMLDVQNPELASTNADTAIKQHYTGSATAHVHGRSSHPDFPNRCYYCGLDLGAS